jgi:hypothetical protein
MNVEQSDKRRYSSLKSPCALRFPPLPKRGIEEGFVQIPLSSLILERIEPGLGAGDVLLDCATTHADATNYFVAHFDW